MVNEEGTSNKSKLIFTWTCSGFKSHLAHFLAQVQTNKKIHNPKNSSYFGKWNFLTLILKNLLYFVKRKLFLHFLNRKFFSYFLKWKPALFTPSSKNKRNPPRENFLYFRKQKSRKISCVFLEESFSYISRNGKSETETLKMLLVFQGGNLQSLKNKKSLLWRNFLSLMTLLQSLHQ